MGVLEAIVLGIAQGLTEFLPISSTAHIRVIPAFFGWADPGAAFTAVIQLGTLLAVLIYFRGDIARIAKAWFRGLTDPSARREQDSKMGWTIALGTIPILVLGLAFKNQIEKDWRSLEIIGWTLIGMGLLMGAAERFGPQRRGVDSVTWKDGLWVGIWQSMALIPGASRSGSTITGGLIFGLDRATAARFSFLLSIPSIFAAGLLSMKEHASALFGAQAVPVLVATVAAFVSGYWAIDFLLKFLARRSVYVFVVYRVVLGAILLVLLRQGILSPMQGIVP
ncbi:MAG: undecaprenyl-diphosphate phosphatase [Fimbriimonadaceae bacterium]|nr:undecaprenyl-diphosphate phosphatase [Fimbriimonadaceae bacterium]